MTLLALPPDEAHLWITLLDGLDDRRLLEAYEALLAPEESARRQRYHFEENRHEYLVTRALARTVLSRYEDVDPRAWVFEAGPHGKPEIEAPRPASPLRFNLSNTSGLVACIVARDREVGVDVEDAARAAQAIGIADRFFSPLEVGALRALPGEAQAERFTAYWTLKEAYIKARGMGLAIPLDQFSFVLDAGTAPQILIDPSLNDDPATWQFARLRPTPRHRLAAAVRIRSGDGVRFVVRRTVPLIL